MPEKIDLLEKSYQLFSSLNALQQKFLSKIEQLVPVITGDVWKRAQENGEVLLNYIAPEIDADLYASLATEICHLLARERGEKKKELERISDFFNGESGRLCQDLLPEEKLSARLAAVFSPTEQELAYFVARQSLRPFLKKFVAQLPPEVGGAGWQRRYCPVCGERPSISYLRREDGKRILVCPLCEQEWLYRYLACTWCGNEDHKSISYFEVREVPGYEVYVCKKCRGYLKTFNERKGSGHEDWLLEDVKTLPLDLIARRDGYSNFQKLVLN